MTQRFWDGGTWIYRATITNDGSNSGNHIYSVVPGEGAEFEILYGEVLNGDVAGRVTNVVINEPGGTTIGRLTERNDSLGAGSVQGFPNNGIGDQAPGGSRYIVSGTMVLLAQINAVAVSQDTAFALGARTRSAPPTVTLASPTDATEVVVIDRVI